MRDLAECVSSGDGNGGLRGFVCIKLELDFHCRGRWGDGFVDIN
jgi:hypothetical protein